MTLNAVIWDLGGVLVRTEDYHPRQMLADRFGMTRLELEELVYWGESGSMAQRGEIDSEQHWDNILRILSLKADELEGFKREFWRGDVVDFELINTIRAYKANFKTGLLSNAFSDLRHVITHIWNFADAFDEMVISAEVGLVKPDLRIYQLALDRLGILADQAIFIDDFIENVEGAQRAGMQAVVFKNLDQIRTELRRNLEEF